MGLFGGKDSSSSSSAISSDTDFADFAASTVESIANAATSVVASAVTNIANGATATPFVVRPSIYGDAYPWYAFWHRASPRDFITEYVVLGFLSAMIAWHFTGMSINRSLAKNWVLQHVPLLQREYARVGFQRALTTEDSVQADVAAGKIVGNEKDLIREEGPQEFVHYASGRMNVTSTVFNINLKGRGNPFLWAFESVSAFFMDTLNAPSDTVIVTTYTADGADASKTGGHNSRYDAFVWAVVNKRTMAKWRSARYDLSLTKTVDTPKLPPWLTVMSESAEITDTLLTKDLITAIEKVGPAFQYILVTDQPLDKPTTLAEFDRARKRLVLVVDLSGGKDNTGPLLEYFLRLPDFLVTNAHFRPEVVRKIRSIRDEERRKLERVEEEKKAEERLQTRDEKKKADRDAKLRGLSAEEQKRFLEKEREKEMKKASKKQVRRV